MKDRGRHRELAERGPRTGLAQCKTRLLGRAARGEDSDVLIRSLDDRRRTP